MKFQISYKDNKCPECGLKAINLNLANALKICYFSNDVDLTFEVDLKDKLLVECNNLHKWEVNGSNTN